MPIGGFVITVAPGAAQEVRAGLAGLGGLEIHGSDGRENLVAVIESETTGKMEKIVREINRRADVLHVGLTFINVEE